jgi:hypothetical protein
VLHNTSIRTRKNRGFIKSLRPAAQETSLQDARVILFAVQAGGDVERLVRAVRVATVGIYCLGFEVSGQSLAASLRVSNNPSKYPVRMG